MLNKSDINTYGVVVHQRAKTRFGILYDSF